METIIGNEYNRDYISNIWTFGFGKRLLNEIDKMITKNIPHCNICQIGTINNELIVKFYNHIQSINKMSIFPIEKIHISKNSNNNVLININNTYLHISLCLPFDYPFKPLKIVTINNKPYSYILKTDTLYLEQLGFVRGYCLCCHSLTCEINWSATYTIQHIFTEIKNFLLIKQAISYLLHCEVIKRKYLIDDIDIMSYLYMVNKSYN